MKKAVIGLGSNLGDRERNLMRARECISARVGSIIEQSSVAETTAVGFIAPPFLNQAIVVQTSLSPICLLDTLQEIERELGRIKKTEYVQGKPIYHSRTIDLDILDYDRLQYHDERLTLPHPQISNRDFIQQELTELGLDTLLTFSLQQKNAHPNDNTI